MCKLIYQTILFLFRSDQSHMNLFATRPQPKKKRKSRTAFTNNQIFELEKRFIYQKYLSPADRDEIAASLGLSNAQVSCLLAVFLVIDFCLLLMYDGFPLHSTRPSTHTHLRLCVFEGLLI